MNLHELRGRQSYKKHFRRSTSEPSREPSRSRSRNSRGSKKGSIGKNGKQESPRTFLRSKPKSLPIYHKHHLQSPRLAKGEETRIALGAKEILKLVKEKKLNYEGLQKAMEVKENCFRFVKGEKFFVREDRNASNVQGIVYKTCGYVVSNCLECKDPLAVKIYIRNSLGSPEPLQEARILSELKEAFDADKIYGAEYSSHIITYVDYIEESANNPNILITELVEFSPGRAMNLKEFLRTGLCTVPILDSLLIQILLTLEYASKRVPGFVHFDLLAQQIFLRDTGKQVTMRTPNSIFKLKTTIQAVIGDFGFSISNMYPNRYEPILKDFQLRVSGFDVYRLLTDCKDYVSFDSNLRHRMDEWLVSAFKGKLSLVEHLRDRWAKQKIKQNKNFRHWGYLPETAGPFIKGTPLEYLKKMPFLKHYFSRV